MTDLERYCTDILDGKIIACKKIKQISEILLYDIAHPGKYHYDPDAAVYPVNFIETFCKQPTGRLGQPLNLQLFQKARINAIFGFVDDNGMRRYHEVLIIEGRKNGKTTEIAAIECYMLIADGEGAPQVYNLATSAEQAGLGFNAVMRMIAQSPTLSKRIKKRQSDLYFSGNLGYIKPLSKETKHLDGLDVHCACVDELAAIVNRDIYDLAIQGMSARSQPLLFTITTNGFVREGIFDSQYALAEKVLNAGKDRKQEHFLPFIYELDDPDKEWTYEPAWIKANPGLGTIKKTDMLREFVDKAKEDPTFKPTVLVKDFNIPQTAVTAWLSWEAIVNHATWKTDVFDYCIGGFDAADKVDLNAAKAVCMRPGDPVVYVKSMYWIPQRVLDAEAMKGNRAERDKIPYELWAEQGHLTVVQGNKVDKHVILDWFLELRDEEGLFPVFIGYDPWHVEEALLRDFKMSFGDNSMIPIRQGARTLSQPMKELKIDFETHMVNYNDNPIDRWNLVNTQIRQDINGNIQPVKSIDRTQRIDGSIALLCAYTVLKNKFDSYINLNEGEEDVLIS